MSFSSGTCLLFSQQAYAFVNESAKLAHIRSRQQRQHRFASPRALLGWFVVASLADCRIVVARTGNSL